MLLLPLKNFERPVDHGLHELLRRAVLLRELCVILDSERNRGIGTSQHEHRLVLSEAGRAAGLVLCQHSCWWILHVDPAVLRVESEQEQRPVFEIWILND